MKLSMKLAIMMGSILIALCLFGLFSLYEMNSINRQSTLIAERYLPVTVNSQRLNTLAANLRRVEIRHTYATDASIMAAYEKEMDTIVEDFNKARAICDSLIINEGTRKQFATLVDAWDEYFIIHTELIEISRRNNEGEAVALLNETTAAFGNIDAEITKFLGIVDDATQRASAVGDKTYEDAQMITTILLLAITLIGIALTIFIIKGVAKQLGKDPGELALIATRVTNGDYNITDGSPTIGVYGNLVDMVKSLETQINNARKESERASQESENAKIATQEAENARVAAEVKREEMLVTAGQLETVAQIVSSATTQLSAQIDQSGKGAGQQAMMASETATAMEEMSATGMEVAKNAALASNVSAQTRLKAEEGEMIVNKSLRSVQATQQESLKLKEGMIELAQHAQSINQIMGVISDIADQTNLLALNAAIEAARAGDAGRGFAVVADEVRKLAEKTMTSTTDVANVIKAIQTSSSKSMELVDSAVSMIEETASHAEASGRALQEIVQMVDQAAGQVEGIATASEEQSAASEEITSSVNQMNTIANETSRAMEEASRAVADLAQQAQGLTKLTEAMRQG